MVGVVVTAGAMAGSAAADVTVNDVSVTEGNLGTQSMTFTITATSGDGLVTWATSPGSATAPSDYTHTTGSVNFDGAGTQAVVVPIQGDTLDEPDETFTLELDTGSDRTGVGTIFDNDLPPGPGPGPGPQPGDQDGDRVPDSQDACPTVFANTPSGCPDTAGQIPDSDGDGVTNDTDACPLVAGSSPSGCPELGGTLPPPAFGKTVNLAVLEDDVFIKLPAGFAIAGSAGAAQKGQGFVPLIEPRQVPVGTLVDTENGKVRLASARGFTGGTQFGKFANGLFQVLQRRRVGAPTVLRLKGSSFRRCSARVAGGGAAAARRRLSQRTVRRLASNANGRFRTRGRHSSATVRGTVWITTDRCDGTLTQVRRGRVAVRDFRRRRTIAVRFGKPYFARAPG